jgi:tyrosyl-tRNA synthetase
LIYDYTEGLPDLLATRNVTLYTGFDPTASSLQVGNLVPLLGLARLQRFGHSPIALAGGGTGMIGDPSGKSGERQLLERDEIEANIEAIKGQLARFLDFGVARNPARILNNVDWLGKLNLLEFLRDVGKHFTVNAMTAKESVRARLESESGISYAEFSYMLLQAYDFLHLFDAYGCLLQAGGSDQWGNITAGTELVRRVRGGGAYGLVYPLLTTPDGTKLGKTASGTVWLDPERTSPYRFYQYWLNQEDAVVIRCLKFLTWLGREEIVDLEQKLAERPEAREAQRALAQEMTRLVHGQAALERAEMASRVLFGGEVTGLSADDVREIFEDVPSTEIARGEFDGEGVSVVDLLATTELARSKSEARRFIEGGGVYINNERVGDIDQTVSVADSIEGRYLILRRGKRRYHLVELSAE